MRTCGITRRDFLFGSIAFAATLSQSRNASARSVNDAEVKAIHLKITYMTEILKSPKGRDINIWMPIPTSDHEQQVTDISVRSRMQHRLTEDPMFKNRIFYFKTERLNAGEGIALNYTVRRKTAGIIEDRQERPERYLEPSEWERWDEKIARYVDGLVGNESDPVKAGRKIYDALIDSLTYVHEACGRGISTLTFEDKKGRCDEFHALFRSMMMYKKIPVRWHQGIALPYPSAIKKTGEVEADCINAHSWLSFHIGNQRWMPVDLSEAKRRPDLREFYFGKLPPNRIRMSDGRGITLSPPQKTPLNTFPYTHIEADGIPLIYGHHYRNRLRYEVLRIEV